MFETASGLGERNANTTYLPIAEIHSKTMLYAIGYRMNQVNSRRRNRHRRGRFAQNLAKLRQLNGSNQNSAISGVIATGLRRRRADQVVRGGGVRGTLARWAQDLDDGVWKSRIAEKKTRSVHRWHGDDEARLAVSTTAPGLGQASPGQGSGSAATRRTQLRPDPRPRRHASRLAARPREPGQRYLVHVAGYNLGLIMRLLVGAGTPREFMAASRRTCRP